MTPGPSKGVGDPSSPEPWDLHSLPAFTSVSPARQESLWTDELPDSRDVDRAVWDDLLSFFEDATTAFSQRPGSLVLTPRILLRNLKHNGSEPRAGFKVLNELVNRGDILRADSLTLAAATSPAPAPSTASSLASTLSSYIFGAPAPKPIGLDDPIVSTAALAAVAARAQEALGGPVSSDDIHTVSSFAAALTARNARDAEAVISHLAATSGATVLTADPNPENESQVFGIKFGPGAATEADKGVLQTKAALQRMELLAAHLEESVAAETAKATAAARAGDKAGALARLRKKKLLDNKLAGARASVHKLTDVLMAVDEAASNKEAVQALEIGMDSLRIATAGGVSAERVDAIAADYAEHTADQEDVRVALQQLSKDPVLGDDTAAEEAELAAMMAAEEAGHPLDVGVTPVAGSAEEEEELDRIMRELGIEKNDTVGLPTPPSPTGKSPEKADASTPAGRILSAPELG